MNRNYYPGKYGQAGFDRYGDSRRKTNRVTTPAEQAYIALHDSTLAELNAGRMTHAERSAALETAHAAVKAEQAARNQQVRDQEDAQIAQAKAAQAKEGVIHA